MSTSPEIIPVDGAGSSPAPKTYPAPVYTPRAPVAASPPLPSEGITVMNRDGSFYTSDLGPQQGAFPDSDNGAGRLLEMMFVSRLFAKKKRHKKQAPQVIVVQVPASSLPVAPEPQTLNGKK